MSKDPSPKADQLRQQREARYGHIQATAEPKGEKLERARKLIPYAGKESKGIAPAVKTGKNPGRKRIKAKENR
jgi:bisphosphoglycerate-dependent phosphoglycerate mutase